MPPSRKIFVSYKYSDSLVAPRDIAILNGEVTQVRHYVNDLETILKDYGHIYKGEKDNEPLDGFKDSTIESKLRNKIFDTTITIVLISKGMKDLSLLEEDQWIPWEISYSLKEMTKNGRTSTTNAMLAIVLPDEMSDYSYFVEPLGCTNCQSIRWKNDTLFKILGANMFNRNIPIVNNCSGGVCGTVHLGENHSYIYPVRWDVFLSKPNYFIDHASTLKQCIDDFDITKETSSND